MTFGQKLQLLRKEKTMSQEALAEQLEVSRQAVSRWELDLSLPETENVIKIGRIFDVSYDYLLKEEERNTSDTETKAKNSTAFDNIVMFIKKYGYLGGYALSAVSAYCFTGYLIALVSVIGMLNGMNGMEGFSMAVTGAVSTGGPILAMLIFYIVLSVIGFAGGIWLAKYLKRKTEKYRTGDAV